MVLYYKYVKLPLEEAVAQQISFYILFIPYHENCYFPTINQTNAFDETKPLLYITIKCMQPYSKVIRRGKTLPCLMKVLIEFTMHM